MTLTKKKLLLNASHYILHWKRSPSDCSLPNDVHYGIHKNWTLCDQTTLSANVWMKIWATTQSTLKQSHHIYRLDGSHRLCEINVWRMSYGIYTLLLSIRSCIINIYEVLWTLYGFYWFFFLFDIALRRSNSTDCEVMWDVIFAMRMQCAHSNFWIIVTEAWNHTQHHKYYFTRVTQSLFYEYYL